MDKRKKNVGGRSRTMGLSHNKKAKTYCSGLSLATSDDKSMKITTFFKKGLTVMCIYQKSYVFLTLRPVVYNVLKVEHVQLFTISSNDFFFVLK